MAIFAASLVLIEPAAASSGIPGLIAYLNGVDPLGGKSPVTQKHTSFTSLKTMFAKLVGMVASIPSGLCIGPEGPIIHISALFAMYTAKVVQYLERKFVSSQSYHASKSERRDFLATGAACGICTAFRAPIAGTLFVVEEAASFFTTNHLEYTFFACLAATGASGRSESILLGQTPHCPSSSRPQVTFATWTPPQTCLAIC